MVCTHCFSTSWFTNICVQGVVGLVGNLGSLVVRTLFAPVEEVAFNAFSRREQYAMASVCYDIFFPCATSHPMVAKKTGLEHLKSHYGGMAI